MDKTVWAVICHYGDNHDLYLFENYNNAVAKFKELRHSLWDDVGGYSEVLLDTDTNYWVDNLDNFGYTIYHIRISIAEYPIN